MKICNRCSAANPDSAKFCSECGARIGSERFDPPLESPMSPEALLESPHREPTGSGAATDDAHPDPPAGRPNTDLEPDRDAGESWRRRTHRRVDIMFVLDCTESMAGEINAIRDVIVSFVEMIEAEGIGVRVGLIEFRDRLCDEEHRVFLFDDDPFTSNAAIFRSAIKSVRAYGGGDFPESSLDALMLAVRQPFSPGAQKVIVLVTDAPPHIPDRDTQTIDEVCDALQAAGVKHLYIIFQTSDPASQVYLELLGRTRGLAWNLGAGSNFRARADAFKRALLTLGGTISRSI